MIRVVLPQHLRTLARVDSEVALDIAGPVTVDSVLNALEGQYPMLRGTIRDHTTKRRDRSFAFSPVSRMYHMNRRILPCPLPWQAEPNPC